MRTRGLEADLCLWSRQGREIKDSSDHPAETSHYLLEQANFFNTTWYVIRIWPMSGRGHYLTARLDIVFREEAFVAMENAFTPAIAMAMHQVYDVTFSNRQVIRSGGLIVVQRHHWTHRWITITGLHVLFLAVIVVVVVLTVPLSRYFEGASVSYSTGGGRGGMMSSKASSSSIRKGGGGARISRSREQHTGPVSDSCD